MNDYLLYLLAQHAVATCARCKGTGQYQLSWYVVGDERMGRVECDACAPIRDVLAQMLPPSPLDIFKRATPP